jgi:hypothetical protein
MVSNSWLEYQVVDRNGGFRCLNGAQTFATLRSLLSTAAKQNLNLLQTIKNAFAGHPPPIPV